MDGWKKRPYKNLHFVSDPRLDTVPRTAIDERVLLQPGRRRHGLIGKFRIDVIEEGQGIGPGRLTDRSPDGGFLNISRRLIEAREEANRIIRRNGRNEQLREQLLDSGIRAHRELRRVRFRTFKVL